MKKCKYGFIHGSFDMFSVDDINAIELAKEECESLIIGVYSDAMFESHTKRSPIIPCKDRITIANAIKGVDCVIEIKDEYQLEHITQMGSNPSKNLDNTEKIKLRELINRQLSLENESKRQQQTPKKYKIGFIQGTFDMFHYGHYNVISKAKEQCEKLIVGVNTDELVRSYKNKTPIVPLAERIRVVEAIKPVDQVVSMEDRDKIKAAQNLGFNALIMGDDWKGTDFYNETEKVLQQIGVEIVYLPYTQGISSTKLRSKIGRDANGNKIGEEH